MTGEQPPRDVDAIEIVVSDSRMKRMNDRMNDFL